MAQIPEDTGAPIFWALLALILWIVVLWKVW